MGLAQLRQPSRLVADHSALLPVLQLYPLAMNFVHGIDPDSHLLGGWLKNREEDRVVDDEPARLREPREAHRSG